MKKNATPAGGKGFAPVIILIIVVVVALAAGYFFVKSDLKNSFLSNTALRTASPTGTTLPIGATSPIATTPPVQESLFTGKLTKLSQDLELFKITDDMKQNGMTSGFVYYSAGQFNEGSLDGYTRIIVTEPQQDPASPQIYTLATKDFKTYVLDDPDSATTKYPEDAYENPYYHLDKTKIISTATFDTDQPQSISLDSNFSLYLDNFLMDSQSNSETDIQTDFSGFQNLASPDKNLTMYFQNESDPNNKYILGNTTVVVVDSTGLPIIYSITTPKGISDYEVSKGVYDAALQKYDQDMDKYNNKQISTSPQYPTNFPFLPHLGFSGSDISNSNGSSFYKDYEVAFPGACAEDLDTRVVNVSDGDLEQIGTVDNMPVFGPKDQNSDLETLEYNSKMAGWANDSADFKTTNPGITEPTNVSDYSKNNPLLFYKDYWGRWIAFGEWDIKLVGGCGKPVIYLYPSRDTEVTLKFEAPINFTTDIPTYGGYWQVLAHSDGSLTNLRPELTNCNDIDTSQIGSEYAKAACLTNNYPYLYWSGNITSVDYPKVSQGWIVGRNDLGNFIDSKLNYMGLNEKERNDFESYWVPEMLGKSSSFYRVSFITTAELNKMFPMMVTPNPDTVFRIFLDWQPLSQKPTNSLQPEVLPKLIRKGFTMVEWGGLKTP
jgi:hypothetical protein